MTQYKICSGGISVNMLKRVAKPFIFGILFFLIISFLLYFLKMRYSPLGVSLITLGLMVAINSAFYLLGNSGLFFEEVNIKILDTCILETKSVDYGDKIYYPLVEYEYSVNNNIYKSKSICLDERSCYLTVWNKNKNGNSGLIFAQKKIDKILKKNRAYFLKVLPFISYLDISLESNRKSYFFGLQVISVFIVFLGIMWL